MKRYDILSANFINSIIESKAKTNKVFKLNNQGKRVINKRTKAYKVAKSEIEVLLSKYSANTVKNIIGVYNKDLINNNLGVYVDILKYIFTPNYIKIGSDYKSNLEYRTNNAILVTNGRSLIDLAIQFIGTYDYIKISIGLAILTGRRTSEILYTGQFKAIDSKHLLFSGQVKQNDSKPYSIPVLGDSKAILKAFSNLRILRSYKSIKHVNEKESSKLNKKVKELLSDYHKGLKMHDLRRFYAYVCYHHEFNNEAKANNRQTFDGYTKEILGHKILKSGESYKVLEVEM